jgi:rubrerythrin
MRRSARGTAAVPLVLVPLLLGALSSPAYAGEKNRPPCTTAIADSTRANLLEAMHGEALARARYLVFGAEAARSGSTAIGRLFVRTAGIELDDHFSLEAGYVGLVQSSSANLTAAIAGESYETTTMYPTFEAEALADGDTAAAALFHEIAADEADHRDAYAQALAALSGTGTTPAPVEVAPVTVPAGAARSSGRTLANLQTAMRGEAFASAAYLAYATHARAAGEPALARLFTSISAVELGEHWAGEAVLAGVVSDTGTNLLGAAAGEDYEATTMYPAFAAEAAAAGDLQVARSLRAIAADEADHRDAFRAAATRLTR